MWKISKIFQFKSILRKQSVRKFTTLCDVMSLRPRLGTLDWPALTHWVRFHFYLRELIAFWLPILVQCLRGFFVYIVSLLAGDKPMLPRFRKVRRRHLLPIFDRFLQHQYCTRSLSGWCQFVSDDLWNSVVCFQPSSLLVGKVWEPVMHLSATPIYCEVHWSVGRRIGLCRLT